MIVTSKRCYLNILTQLCDLDTLLNANYYIADVRNPTEAYMMNLNYNDAGQLVDNPESHSGSLTKYNITYGNGELDPSPFITNVMIGIGEQYEDPIDMFIRSLNSSDTMVATYRFLFSKPPRGNGLQILIFNDDSIVDKYVHIVCGYLAKNFGVDINFIDPAYRPKVSGLTTYIGDKLYAEKTIKDIRDAQLLINFNQAFAQSNKQSTINNLQIYLSTFNAQNLIYLYELLFPNDPLPTGNHTTDHVRQIIIGRTTQNMPESQFNNLFSLDSYIDQYNDLDEEYGDGGFLIDTE